ncbi:hypothetical protein PLESTB_001898600 [Pleodorina starrii]|uniref:HTH lysR-type domain-containing protein n=1 Tax=Pleodorina starrii TaxID=330485 RepID=A0A9W6FAK1_9CHLO|nr:hypothetical protein PLESTB_001898600 [Pleodorina starrii]
MDRPNIPLNALRAFEASARHLTLSKAAIELCVTQAALSHQIRNLEERLGVALFRRVPRGLVLTDEGAALAPVLTSSLDIIATTLDRFSGGRYHEALHIGVVGTFATGWLIPRLAGFEAEHPEVDLRIFANNNRVSIPGEGLDLAIRFGDGSWHGLEAVRIMEAPLTPMCAPDYDRLEDWIGEDHLVRVVDLFVDELDLPALGFARSAPARTGRPGYHPAVLLKLFIYGYLNRIPSSRRLEREAGRNVELMWLTGRLVTDHKTIADFRRDNGPGIRRSCAQFVELSRRIGVLKGACVAIDGSKFRAVNSRDRNFTKGKIASRIAHLEADVERYIAEMVRVDRQEEGEVRAEKVAHLAKRYGRVRQHIQHLQAMGRALADAPDGQISLTDPDARAMATSARNSGMVGYNVQTAVDTETHLIVAHEVTNRGHDRDLLVPMAKAAKDALHRDEMHVLADKGYFSGRQILACHKAGITTTIPRPETSGNRLKGMYEKADFAYEANADIYRCPAGEALPYRYTTEEDGLELRRYWTSECGTCLMKSRCTTGKERRITRWAHEHLVEAARARLIGPTEPMTIRRGTVEHPFGTIKAWMGTSHFLTQRLRNVKTEIALNVLAYNIKRMVALIGVQGLMSALKA